MPVSNTFLTPKKIVRKALARFHQKANFITNINRQYDEEFAVKGKKIGAQLDLRMPNKFVTRDGLTMDPKPIEELSIPVVMSQIVGVDMEFNDVDLTLTMDDFDERYIEPAVDQLRARVESKCLSMINGVNFTVANFGQKFNFDSVAAAQKILNDNLCPESGRKFLLNTQDEMDMIKDNRLLFNDRETVSREFREGVKGDQAGFTFLRSTLIPTFVSGANVGTGYTVTASVTGKGITSAAVGAGAGSMVKGDVFTVAGCYRVHPESREQETDLMQFVVTQDLAGPGVLNFAPAMYTLDARQNVTSSGFVAGSQITKLGAASKRVKPSLAFHKDAFAYVSADFPVDKDVKFCYSEVGEGVSMRIWKASEIRTGLNLCRLDVLFGFANLRQELACKTYNN